MKELKILSTFLIIISCSLTLLAQDVVYEKTFDPPQMIPDPGCITIDIPVSGTNQNLSASFGLKKLCINVDHNRLDNLQIVLISPAGIRLSLIDRRGGGGDDLINTCFVGDAGALPISDGTPPFTGDFLPEIPMGLLNDGSAADGIWKLEFCDVRYLTVGQILNYSLTFGDNAPIIPTPDNDECALSLLVPVNQNYDCTNVTFGTISNATPSSNLSDCQGFVFDDDVWFAFTAADEQHVIDIVNINPATTFIAEVYSGGCNALVSLGCFDAFPFQVGTLIPGNNYYVRLASAGSNIYTTIFDVCVKEGIPPPPANDNYCGAFSLNSGNGNCYSGATFAGATTSSGYPSCSDVAFPDPNNDIWFEFTASSTAHTIQVTNMVGTSKFIYFQVLQGSATCSEPPSQNFQNISCYIDGNPGEIIGFVTPGLIVGSKYYIRLSTFSAPHNTVFDICVDASNVPPNDECVNAITIIPDICDPSVIYTISDATASSQIDNCEALPIFKDDVWFKFTATSTSHTIDAINISGSSDDLIFSVLTASCSGPGTVLCYDGIPNGSFDVSGLTIGSEYLIRVGAYEPNTQFIDFALCVKTTASCPKYVLTTSDEGSYSLSNNVLCSQNGDIITFGNNLSGVIFDLASPILFNRSLTLDASTLTSALRFRNEDLGNTSILIDINADVIFRNINIEGKSLGSMKVTVRTNGSLTLQENN